MTLFVIILALVWIVFLSLRSAQNQMESRINRPHGDVCGNVFRFRLDHFVQAAARRIAFLSVHAANNGVRRVLWSGSGHDGWSDSRSVESVD